LFHSVGLKIDLNDFQLGILVLFFGGNMLLVDAPRAVFQVLSENCTYVEIGVYRGAYTDGVYQAKPSHMYLIDPWEEPPIEILIPQDYASDPIAPLKEAFEGSGYYQGGLKTALEDAFKLISGKYGDDPKVTILKNKSVDACNSFKNGSVDYLYIDGNHRYDFVLADLERWAPKVAENGVIVLNDCYVSPIGKMQHLSVLEALSTFIKLSDFVPIAMVQESFGDVVITRKTNKEALTFALVDKLIKLEQKFIIIPDNLVHSAKHKKMYFKSGSSEHFREVLSFE